MGKAIDEQIAVLEDILKDKEFEIKDALYTIKHTLKQMQTLRAEIAKLRSHKGDGLHGGG